MNARVEKWRHFLLVVVCLIGSYVEAQSDAHSSPQDFKTRAVFELVVNDSSVLNGGPSRIVTQSAFVTRAHGLIREFRGTGDSVFHQADYRASHS